MIIPRSRTPDSPGVDVGAFIDDRRVSSFNVRLVLLSCSASFFAGLDMAVIAYTAPYIRDELALSNTLLGQTFSAGVLGLMIGGFLFSWLGDRFGRRWPLVAAAAGASLLSLATVVLVRDPAHLIALRLLSGIAIGGVLPLTWTLNVEYAPRRMRATAVTVVMLGYSAGTALSAVLSNLVAPTHGWRAVYLIAGAGTLLCTLALWRWLPESIRFLAATRRRPHVIASTLNALAGRQWVDATHEFRDGNASVPGQPSPSRQMFAGDAKYLTLAVWLGYVASSLAMYFIATWGPTLLERMGLPRSDAATLVASGTFLGALAGLALTPFTDRVGPVCVALYPLLAIPVLLAIGFADAASPAWLLLLGPLLLTGSHYGITSLCALYHPTVTRASGTGWSFAIAKLGGISGPLLGGAVLSLALPPNRSFMFLALCPAVLAGCAFVVALIVPRLRRLVR